MNCEEFERHLDAYIEKDVSTARAHAMDEHRHACRNCARLAQAYETTLTALDSTKSVEAPLSLVNSILAHVAAHAETAPVEKEAAPSINCETFEQNAAAFTDGTLGEQLHAALDTHRLTCRSCARIARAHESILGAFERAEQVAAPKGLTERIMSAVRQKETMAARETGIFWKMVIPAAACVAAMAGYLTYALPWRTAMVYLQAQSAPTHMLPGVLSGAQDWLSSQTAEAAALLAGWYQASDLAAWMSSTTTQMGSLTTTAVNFLAEPLTLPYVSTGMPVYVIVLMTMGLLVAGSYLTGGMTASYVER